MRVRKGLNVHNTSTIDVQTSSFTLEVYAVLCLIHTYFGGGWLAEFVGNRVNSAQVL